MSYVTLLISKERTKGAVQLSYIYHIIVELKEKVAVMSSSLTAKSMSSPILILPHEIRRHIYRYILPVQDGVILSLRDCDRSYYSLHQNLMKTCSIIYQEMSSMLYGEYNTPITVSCGEVHLLDIWRATCRKSSPPIKYPLSHFPFRNVKRLDVSIIHGEKNFKCVAMQRGAVIDLCFALHQAQCALEYLCIRFGAVDHIAGPASMLWLEELRTQSGSYLRPVCTLVPGTWDIEAVAQPFRLLHGIPEVDIVFCPKALALFEIRAWKESMQRALSRGTPCDDAALDELREISDQVSRSLDRECEYAPTDIELCCADATRVNRYNERFMVEEREWRGMMYPRRTF